MLAQLVIGGLAAAGVIALVGKAHARPAPSGGGNAGLEQLFAVLNAAGVPDDWQVFLGATAYGESRWNPNAVLGPEDAPGRPPWAVTGKVSASTKAREAEAAATAFSKNRDQYFAASPFDDARYSFGSGGWFGLLPAYGLISGFKATPELIATTDPWSVTDPLVSVVMALGLARGLMRWESFDEGGRTWLALRIGWGLPSAMWKAPASVKYRAKFAGHVAQLGVEESFLDEQVSPLDLPKGGELLELLEQSAAQQPAAA